MEAHFCIFDKRTNIWFIVSVFILKTDIDTAEPEIKATYFYSVISSTFSKPGTYLTQNSTQLLTAWSEFQVCYAIIAANVALCR